MPPKGSGKAGVEEIRGAEIHYSETCVMFCEFPRSLLNCSPQLPNSRTRGRHASRMNAAMALQLDSDLRGKVTIDTPERWQGLERKVMVIVHPLSGVIQPSEFDLATGRLCVMASRHQIALVVVTRDHLTHTLETHLPVANQPIGQDDTSGAGHFRNLSFWNSLQDQDRVIALPR